jgi:hypothetical protein
MSDIKDGGSAFPMPAHTDQNGTRVPMAGGMNLRDYFAAKALQGYMVGLKPVQDIGPGMLDRIAEGMYSMADAMLAAREAK